MNHTFNPVERSLKVDIPGDILSTNAEQIRTEILALFESPMVKPSGFSKLILNLVVANMVDSVGLNVLVGLYKEAKKRGAQTSALISSPNIQRTFAFTRLDAHIQVVMTK